MDKDGLPKGYSQRHRMRKGSSGSGGAPALKVLNKEVNIREKEVQELSNGTDAVSVETDPSTQG